MPEPPDPADFEPDLGRLAGDALERGQQEAARSDPAAARRWFERACRLAPGNDTAKLCLAGACLNHDDARAAELFADVLKRHDLQPAWAGLALARLRLGQPALAAEALAAGLGRFAVDPGGELATIAGRIAGATGTPGWCGVSWPGDDPDATLLMGPPGRVELVLDGRPAALRGARLPPGWQQATRLEVRRDGRTMLGSPIDIAALCRTEGCVWAAEGDAGNPGLEGWAWQPGNPQADPVLTVRAVPDAVEKRPRRAGKALVLTARDLATTVAGSAILARPRRFQVPASALAGLSGGEIGQVSVTGPDGRQLAGSPLDPGAAGREAVAAALAVAARFPAGPPAGRRSRRPPVDVVIPVHGGGKVTLDCIDTVLASLPRASRLVVVDDASPEAGDVECLVGALNRLAAGRRIRLIRHAANLGFPASANAGLRACAGRDVVLLNSDTLVPPGWLERLRDVAYSAGDIGTVTPLSNDATILSYPHPAIANPVPSLAETERLDRIATKANGNAAVDVPTAVGFCMYIRRDCLDAAGALREDLFAQGYGEENDFCMRAHHLGWRHVAAPGVFVAHRSGQSFGNARVHLLARNLPVLDRLHPGYAGMIARHAVADPLARFRRRIDTARWLEGRRRGAKRAAMLLITHFHGGGTERHLRTRIEAARAAGLRAVVLRPARLADGSNAVMLGDGGATDYPNLRFALPAELPALLRLLAAERPAAAELHHLLGHDPSLRTVLDRLGLAYDVHVHDFAAFCPRLCLLGPGRRYCGEPEIVQCEACIADIGRKDGLDLPVAELRRQSAALLGGAGRVVVPSPDTGTRIRRHFPSVDPEIAAHGDDGALTDPPPPRLAGGFLLGDGTARAVCRIAVIGAIGLEKGYEVLLACARDAAWRDLPLEFIVIGHSIGDPRLLATGRVFITGEYRPEEAVDLIRAQQASLALIPSIWPETWCFTLTEAWQAGLNAACFDIGAPAERVRRSGRGVVLPLGLSAGSVNQRLMAAAGLARDEGA